MKNALGNRTEKNAEKKSMGRAGSASCGEPAGGGGGFILRMNSLRRVHAELCKLSSTPRRPSAKGGGFRWLRRHSQDVLRRAEHVDLVRF